MSEAGETFFISAGCMDGRVQDTVASFGRGEFGVLYADTITEAGLVGLLSQTDIDQNILDSLKKKINISLTKHHSKSIVVYGHEDCAGNPVDDNLHREDIRKSVEIIRNMIKASVPVIGIFVKRTPDHHGWKVEQLNPQS